MSWDTQDASSSKVLTGCLQDSETPSPTGDPVSYVATSGGPTSESPQLVSPCGDLVAQTGAMLIDDPCIRFNSPFPKLPRIAPAQGVAHPGTHTQTDANFGLQFNTTAASAGSSMAHQGRQVGFGQFASCSMQQSQTAPLQSFQHSASGLFPDWALDRASPSPEPMSSSPEHIQRPTSSYLQPDMVRPGLNCGNFLLHVMPVTNSNYGSTGNWSLQQPGFGFPSSRATNLPHSDARHVYGYAQPVQGLSATAQCQNRSFLPLYSGAPPHAVNGNTAIAELARSTAATADLLACMAANSSHVSPASASHLILATSATFQAFARAAQSTQTAAVAQQGNGAGGVLLTNTAAYSHMPEQQMQQMAHLQHWRQQQQQQLLPHWAADHQS